MDYMILAGMNDADPHEVFVPQRGLSSLMDARIYDSIARELGTSARFLLIPLGLLSQHPVPDTRKGLTLAALTEAWNSSGF